MEMAATDSGTARRIGTGAIVRYAAIGFVTKALTLPLISYLPPAYAQATGLSLATIGVLFMIARLWDILLDPIAGYCIDRFDPPFGPRKFWITLAALVMFLTIPPVFAPGAFGLGRGGAIALPAVLLLIFYFGWTMMSVAHAAWPAELSEAPADRARLIAWREWAGVLGMLGIVSAPALVEHLGGGRLTEQLSVMGGFAMIALPIALALALGLPSDRRRGGGHADPLAVLRLLRGSGRLRRLLLADLLSGSGFAVISATSFFILSLLGLGASFSTLMLVYFIGMIAGVPLFLRLTILAGTRKSFAVAMIGAAVATLGLALVPHGALGAALALQFAVGLFTGGYQSNLNAAMVEVADDDADRAGHSTMGSHFALLALTNKLGYAVAIGICYPLLDALGFHGTTIAPGSDGALLKAIGLGGAAILLTIGGSAFPGSRNGSRSV
jgi:glycoside/pentoside/hexuronide:cation symporter, GPH family